MSMLVITIFLLLAAGFRLIKRRRAAFVCAGAAIVVFYAIGCGLVPKLLLERLQTRSRLVPEWKTANAIVVLGYGSNKWPRSGEVTSHAFGYARVQEGARLYFLCKKQNAVCKIFLTGGDPAKNGISEARMMGQELAALGAAEEDLVFEDKSNNTFQNAQFTSPLLHTENPDYTVLVTSGTHMSRALTYFAHFQTTPVAAPADHIGAGFSWLPRSPNFFAFDLAFHEHAGLLRYRLYNLMNWNPTVSKPGSL